MLDTVRRDVRGGWRSLVKTPLASAIGFLTIGGATGLMILTAAFVYSVLLRPLPFDRADRLMAVQPTASQFEALELRSFRAQQTSFDHVHGYYQRRVTLTAPNAVPETLRAAFVTAGTLDMLGARPILGRTIRQDEDFSANIRVTVVGEQLWRSRFGADPAIVGRRLEIDGQQPIRLWIRSAIPRDAALPGTEQRRGARGVRIVTTLGRGQRPIGHGRVCEGHRRPRVGSDHHLTRADGRFEAVLRARPITFHSPISSWRHFRDARLARTSARTEGCPNGVAGTVSRMSPRS